MRQGSKEWHAWRRQGVGASEVAAVRNESPWSDPYKLWLEKTGRSEGVKENWAMRRGKKYEEEARQAFIKATCFPMTPKCMEHPEYPFIRASLDGISDDGTAILEIKCPGKAVFEEVAKGDIPIKYYSQVQMQLEVSGAETAYFWAYDIQNYCGYLAVTEKNVPYIEETIEMIKDFWDKVLMDIPPLEETDEHLEENNG